MGFAFAFLFYHFELGVNALLFDGLLLLLLLGGRPELACSSGVRWATACLLASALSLVIVNTDGALLAHHLSVVLLVGFTQRRELRFLFYALLLGLLSLVSGPLRIIGSGLRAVTEYEGRFAVGRWLVPGLTALVVCVPFVVLYSAGSVDFLGAIEWLLNLIPDLLDDRTAATLVLLLFGLNLGVALLFPLANAPGEISRPGLEQQLKRVRIRSAVQRSPLALKRAYRSALATLFLLNALLLVVNLTDVINVWIGYRPLTAPQLSQFVHEGTATLLLSIFLAMVCVLVVFRRNLNFYHGAGALRAVAYFWLIQNAFLALSVGLRNAYYIRAYGLAHGRVIVMLMIVLVLTGLFPLYRKVRFRRTLSYLLQVNGLALWLALVGNGAVNWSVVITRFNLNRPGDRVDWDYLVRDLDDTNTFLLREHLDRVPVRFRKRIRARRVQAPQDWRSWNYAAWRNRN